MQPDLDTRLAAQQERNQFVVIDPRATRVRELVGEIAKAKRKNLKVYNNVVALQQLEIERTGLIGEMRSEVRVEVDNGFAFDVET